VYPYNDDPDFVDKLWEALNHPDTLANLPRVAKSYGGGAIKVEPRALERLPIPTHVLQAVGIETSVKNQINRDINQGKNSSSYKTKQLQLF
jgi:hypothetical protein